MCEVNTVLLSVLVQVLFRPHRSLGAYRAGLGGAALRGDQPPPCYHDGTEGKEVEQGG